MNTYDSSKIGDILKTYKDMNETDNIYEADLLILNTCSIREKSQEKVYSELGYWKKIKQIKKNLIICICGCVASQEGKNILKRAPFVDIIFGPQTIHKLIKMINNTNLRKKQQIDISFPSIEKYDFFPKPTFNKISAFVSIQEGCNKFCSYCIVPYTRGKEVNRKFTDILYECFLLSNQGVKEIILLGQNVNAYISKNTNGEKIDLSLLIFYISEIEGIKRIDFTTSHPTEFTENLMHAYGNIPKLVKHLHLPVQSGSNRILKKMKRGYSVEEYKKKIYALKEIDDSITIGSDFIVGFPGESRIEFYETLHLVDKVNFAQSFSFIYSKRPGTPAEELVDLVPLREKKGRLQELQSSLKSSLERINKKMKNSFQNVLVTHASKKVNDQLIGKNKNNRIIKFCGNKSLIGKEVTVKITDCYLNNFKGDMV